MSDHERALLAAGSPDVALMTAHDGQRYFCAFPGAPRDEDGEPSDGSPDLDSPDSSRGTDASEVARRLDDALAKTCHYRIEGWWTYEYCHRRHVRQYHQDAAAASSANAEYKLGTFDAAQTAAKMAAKESARERSAETPRDDGERSSPAGAAAGNNADASATPGEETRDRRGAASVSHVFTGGTPCDLADLNRETEVIFKCSDQSDGVVAIVDVSEPATCRYALTLATPAACDPSAAAAAPTPRQIECRAVDEKSETAVERDDSAEYGSGSGKGEGGGGRRGGRAGGRDEGEL